MTVYGYSRVSTKRQSQSRQNRAIKAEFPDAVLIEEIYTGTSIDRPKFTRLLKHLQPGDTVVFDSVSRMSRNAEEGFSLYKKLFNENINLVFIKERHIDTDTYKKALKQQIDFCTQSGDAATDKLMKSITDALNEYMLALAEKQILLAFEQSQKEVDDLRKRTKEGLVTAKLNGKQVGRANGSKNSPAKADKAKKIILEYSKDFNGSMKDVDVIKLCEISPRTFYNYKKELLENLQI